MYTRILPAATLNWQDFCLDESTVSRISEGLEKRGGQLAMPPEGFYVGITEGHLLEGELERAAEWARAVLAVKSAP